MMVSRWPEHFLFEDGGFTSASAPVFGAEGEGDPRSRILLVRVSFSHVREKACPRFGGSAFFESEQRDPGVSSKAHELVW